MLRTKSRCRTRPEDPSGRFRRSRDECCHCYCRKLWSLRRVKTPPHKSHHRIDLKFASRQPAYSRHVRSDRCCRTLQICCQERRPLTKHKKNRIHGNRTVPGRFLLRCADPTNELCCHCFPMLGTGRWAKTLPT